MSGGRVDQKFYAPVGKPGMFGAWRIVLFNPDETAGGTRTEKIVVATSLAPVLGQYGAAFIEAEFLGEGECLVDVGDVSEIREAGEA